MNKIILEDYTLAEFRTYLDENKRRVPALHVLQSLYSDKNTFPDLNDYRLGPNAFDKIKLSWILFLTDEADPQLAGHGITAGIHWDGKSDTLPDGWQGVVLKSYKDSVSGAAPNTIVGLFIRVEPEFREGGIAKTIAEEMGVLREKNNLTYFILPLRPPLRYEQEYASLPFATFAAATREDGLPLDHWVRMHVRLGAAVIRISEKSHRHVLNLKDFNRIFSSHKITQSGEQLVQNKNNGWYQVYADVERDFVLIEQGCVWVKY